MEKSEGRHNLIPYALETVARPGSRESRVRRPPDAGQNVVVRLPALPALAPQNLDEACRRWVHNHLPYRPSSGKLPELDCISLGPDLTDIHTPRERLHIASTERTWRLLLGTLKRLDA